MNFAEPFGRGLWPQRFGIIGEEDEQACPESTRPCRCISTPVSAWGHGELARTRHEDVQL